MFGSSGSSSRCASFQWAGDLPMGNASSTWFGKSCRDVCCMFRGWTRWTQLAMDHKYLVCMLCLTMDTDTVTQIPDALVDCARRRFWRLARYIWSAWKHFELVKFINADAYNPQMWVTIDLILCELIVEVTSVRDSRGQSRKVCWLASSSCINFPYFLSMLVPGSPKRPHGFLFQNAGGYWWRWWKVFWLCV